MIYMKKLVSHVYSFLFLTMVAIIQPWLDLLESVKKDTSRGYICRRKTLEQHILNEYKDLTNIQYFFKCLNYLSLLAAIVLNTLFFPLRILAMSTKKSKSIELRPMTNTRESYFFNKPSPAKNDSYNAVNKALTKQMDNFFTSLQASKKAINVFRYRPI